MSRIRKGCRLALAGTVGALLAPSSAHAFAHLWKIVEVYSSADGSVQFIELQNTSNNEQFLSGLTLKSNTNTFTFNSNLPSSSTANKRVLIATGGFGSLAGGVTPDYTFSTSNFFSTSADTLNFANFNTLTFTAGQLPTDGVNSLNRLYTAPSGSFTTGTNSPTNFAGASGSVNVAPPGWKVNADGNWSNSSNWQGDVPNAVGATANFGGVIQAPRTVTVDLPLTVGTITFANANTYTIAGSSAITLDGSSGSAAINVTQGGHIISAPLILDDNLAIHATPAGSMLSYTHVNGVDAPARSVTKTGAGTFATTRLRAAGLTVSAGTVAILADGGDDGVSRLQSLTIDASAKLNLNDNDLIVDGGDYTTIETAIVQGYNNGNWLGSGITSSAAATNASLFALGIADNDDLNNTEFSGQTGLDGDEILVKFTYVGDANLTGGVNLDDFNQFLFGFNPANAAPQIWLNGDFNYTGAVNLDDFNLFLFGLANQGPGAPGLVSPELFAALTQFASTQNVDIDLSSVPEPAALALWGVAATLMRRRARPTRKE